MFGVNTVTTCAICGGNIIVVGAFAICPTCMLYVDPDSGEPYNTDVDESEFVDDFEEDHPPIDEFFDSQDH